ncbi:amino acid synthesis family protein [Arthrobacter sp. TmT3-37]
MTERTAPGASGAGVRKIVYYQEDVLLENGQSPAGSIRRATVAAVVSNPWAGTGPDTDLASATEDLAPQLARVLTDRLLEGLGGAEQIEAFGKAAIVGTAGEIEHAGALIHTPFFGNLVREFLEGSSIICFADDRAEPGQPLVVPMWHKTHAATRSHYQTITTRVSDGPRADEIVVVVAASTGSRPHPRIGDRITDPVVTSAILEGASA